MATQEQNERLTRVGPGTPMGNLLAALLAAGRHRGRAGTRAGAEGALLGEDLTLFRTERGEYGLIDDRCPHRCMSLEYGIPEEGGLRCAYHGWLFDAKGHCLEQPFEDRRIPKAATRTRSRSRPIRCEELGGLVFAYLGPEPAPLLPRWDVLVREDLDRVDRDPSAALQLAAMHGQRRRPGAFRIPARGVRQLSAQEARAGRRR